VFALITGIAMCLASCSPKPSSVSGADSGGETTETTIRVMTYNIHHCNPPGRDGVIDHRDSANRQSQVEEVVKIAAREQLPFILAGDFNAVPNSQVMQTVKSRLKLSCDKCPLTSSAQKPVRTIDYIVFRDPSNKLRVENHEAINEDQSIRSLTRGC
jgi:endonuclease/exonuclease/phosphatase family metal-dependent hydrolase